MKRATKIKIYKDGTTNISIHALVKRATSRLSIRSARSSNFNPRPREEGDVMQRAFDPLNMISIHALVKRATVRKRNVESVGLHFNPRPREEGDNGRYNNVWYYGNFNPRPREEGDNYKILRL